MVISALNTLVFQYPAYGFSKLFVLIRRQGHVWNHKRVHRVYCKLGLSKRRRTKKRIPIREPIALQQPLSINPAKHSLALALRQQYLIAAISSLRSMDFMSDSLDCGRRFHTFNVVNDFNREALAIEVDLSLPAKRITRVLGRVNTRPHHFKDKREMNKADKDFIEFIKTAEDSSKAF